MMLNSDNIAYIIVFRKHNVGGEKMKKRILVILVLFSLLTQNVTAIPVSIDTALERLKEGIVKNISVDFNKTVTRGEAIQLLSKIFERREIIKEGIGEYPFIDIPKEANEDIGALYQARIIKGVSDKIFGYNQTITLKEFLIMCLRSFSYPDIDAHMSDLEYECQRVLRMEEFPVSLAEIDRALTYRDLISIGYDCFLLRKSEVYEAYMHKKGAIDICKAGEWVYYTVLGDDEGFHKYSPTTKEDIYIRPFGEIAVNGNTAITSQLIDDYIVYRIQDLAQTDEQGNIYTSPAKFYRLNLKNNEMTKEVIGKVKNLTEDSLKFDQIEWLSLDKEDDTRVRSLKLNKRNDFPNGFYIYNEAIEFTIYSLTDATTYQIMGEDGIRFEYVTKAAFQASLGDEKVYTLLIDYENKVQSIIQVYIP